MRKRPKYISLHNAIKEYSYELKRIEHNQQREERYKKACVDAIDEEEKAGRKLLFTDVSRHYKEWIYLHVRKKIDSYPLIGVTEFLSYIKESKLDIYGTKLANDEYIKLDNIKDLKIDDGEGQYVFCHSNIYPFSNVYGSSNNDKLCSLDGTILYHNISLLHQEFSHSMKTINNLKYESN